MESIDNFIEIIYKKNIVNEKNIISNLSKIKNKTDVIEYLKKIK